MSELRKLISSNVLKSTGTANPQAIAMIRAVLRKSEQKPVSVPRDRSKKKLLSVEERSWKGKEP
jgi:hypothetical protein